MKIVGCSFALIALISCGGCTVRVGVQANFDNGRPVPNVAIGLSRTGYGIRGGTRTDSGGAASLTVPRGKRILLMGMADTSSGCLSPVSVGPDNYTRVIHVVYSLDGCREEFNVVHAGLLHASIPGKFSQVPIKVVFPNGSPAYDADVTIESRRPGIPFVSVLRSDRNGQVDLPIPNNQEFKVQASIHRAGIDCDSQSLLFDTDTGIRWRDDGSRQGGVLGWSDSSTSAISLMLAGGSCRPGT